MSYSISHCLLSLKKQALKLNIENRRYLLICTHGCSGLGAKACSRISPWLSSSTGTLKRISNMMGRTSRDLLMSHGLLTHGGIYRCFLLHHLRHLSNIETSSVLPSRRRLPILYNTVCRQNTSVFLRYSEGVSCASPVCKSSY
jgi:hypothetical protein